MEELETFHFRHGRLHGWISDLSNLSILEASNGSTLSDTTFTTLSDTIFPTTLYNTTNVTQDVIRVPAVHPTVFVYVASILILFCMVSLIVNVVILSSVCFVRTRVFPTLYISLSLTGADTFSLFFFALGLFLFTLLPRIGVELDAPCLMLLVEALRMGAIMTTLLHLAALAGNHYLGILQPLRYPVYMARRNIQYGILVLWTVPPALLILDMFFLEGDGFHTCPYKFLMRAKFRTRFSIPFFTTLGMMIFIYLHIYRLVCRHQKQPLQGKFPQSFKKKVRGSGFSGNQVNEKAIITTLMILGSTIFGWLPAFTYFALFCADCLLSEYWNLGTLEEFIVVLTVNFLVILKTATNSYIYAFRVREIKIALRRMQRRALSCLGMPRADSTSNMTRTFSRQSSRTRTQVCRMNSYQEAASTQSNGTVALTPARVGSLRRSRSTHVSRHKQSNTSV